MLLEKERFRDVIGHFASGVTIVTTRRDDRPLGATASAVSSLCLEPPMLLVCLNRESSTGQAIARSGRFAVNILAEGQGQLARHFAGKGDAKFDGVELAEGVLGVPVLGDALATLECRVSEQAVGGTHVVFLAEVDAAEAQPGAPLAYWRGGFGRFEPFAVAGTQVPR